MVNTVDSSAGSIRTGSSFYRFILFIFSVIFTTLLIFSLPRAAAAVNSFGSNLSFASFLDFLSNVQSFPVLTDMSIFTIAGDWGIIDVLRQALNSVGSLLGVLVYLASNVINLLYFCFQFIQFLFA